MTRRRWIADEVEGNRAALVGAHAEHLVVVLRARVGQQFDLATGAALRRGSITAISPSRVEFELGEELATPSLPNIVLLLSIFKFDRMEWAIEKCVELGVAGIVPVIARRTDAHLARAAQARMERWQRIARQASEQARRADVPEFESSRRLQEAISRPAPSRIVLAETERQLLLKDALQAHSPQDTLLLALGPEGGWSEEELLLFNDAGWTSASLGPTILRAETAAIAATAIAMAELS